MTASNNHQDPGSGTIAGTIHTLMERVYFEHTDFSGIVYHARYLDFLEHGRSNYVRMLGVHHTELANGHYGESLAFAVHHMDLSFVGPAHIDEILCIETEQGILKGPKLIFNQRISRDGTKLLSAKVTVVLINKDGKPRRYPKDLLARLGIASKS